nr:putative ribonuclease H-like domain-containing protein [Tanacetum cinerariifolium]
MEQPNPTFAKILILDTASDTGSASEGSAKKKGRTIAVTIEDMQKRRNDVKARTTLLLALPDEHQLRFNKQQAIVSHLEFIDVEIEQDDLNQKFLTSLAPEWLMYMIVWRNKADLDTMSLDDLYNHLKVYEPEVQKKSELNSQNMAFISSSKNRSGKEEVNTASIPTASTQVSPASANVATGKKITMQGTDVAGFNKLKVECFNCHKMGHFARECRSSRSQDRGRRENFKQGSKTEELAPKALMAINEVGWDWSYMANEEENHALVADEDATTEFALMAKSCSKNEVFDNSLCSKTCKKNTDSLNTKITELSEKLSDTKTTLYHYKLDDTITDYSMPSPSIKSNSNDLQSSNSSISENEESFSSILSKPVIIFVKAVDSLTVTKTNKDETVRKSFVKYAEMPFQRKSAVRTQFRVPRVSTVHAKFPIVNRKFPTDFKLKDDTNVLLKTPRQHNMYSIDLNNIYPHKDLTCLVAKAFADKYMLWHRRLGHLNFKTINKLVRHNLVRGLPSKCFDNYHTCVACLKGKQHKASCKTKLVNSVSKPLHTLHIDLFGPTSVSSLNHKWYCLVVTDDFSRFTWTFFLKTKDETSGILRNFNTEIENLKELKVKIIKCDNRGEFRNKEMNDFCSRKGIKREFSNARTLQQNGVAERRNRTLIEAARTMLADAKLPVT